MLNNVFNKYISTAISMDFKQYTVKKKKSNAIIITCVAYE